MKREELLKITLPREGTETISALIKLKGLTIKNYIAPRGDGNTTNILRCSTFSRLKITLPREGTETSIYSS